MLRVGLKRKKLEPKRSKRLKNQEERDQKEEYDSGMVPLGKSVKDDLEQKLEAAVFGQDDDVLRNLELSHRKPKKLSDDEDADDSAEELKNEKEAPKPAWEDEDDQELNTGLMLKKTPEVLKKLTDSQTRKNFVKKKFTQVMGEQPTWAKLKHERASEDGKSSEDDESDDSGDEMLKKVRNVISKSNRLGKGTLRYRKCADLNKDCRDISIIKHVEFHPSAQVAAIAGVSGNVSLFQVDGHLNPKIQTVHFDNFPIEKAHFSKDGEEIIVASKCHSHFFYYDMIKGKINQIYLDRGMEQDSLRNFEMSPDGKYMAVYGKYGNIHILTAKTKEWITSVKMNGTVSAVTFNVNGSHMYTHGCDGEVYVWDTRDWGHCYHRFFDDGCTKGTAICLSPNQQYLACGSQSGVVNIYNTDSLSSSNNPKPMKILLNMTTEITDMKFNSTSEMLVMSSWKKDNAMKLVHFPSFNVYSNFPSFKENLRRVANVDFSLNSGYLTIANNCGRAFLFRLKHFKNY